MRKFRKRTVIGFVVVVFVVLSGIGVWLSRQEKVQEMFQFGEFEASKIDRKVNNLADLEMQGKLEQKVFDTDLPETFQSKSKQTLSYKGHTLKYAQGGIAHGQQDINAHPMTSCSTWGGERVQNDKDKKNTHFIGHNYGAFTMFLKAKVGEKIKIVDTFGQTKNYTIKQVVQTDIYGVGLKNQVDYWNKITGTGGGERITIQTCVDEQVRLILFAY